MYGRAGARRHRGAVGTVWVCLLVLVASGSVTTSGAAEKPPVPPGRDPGGPAVVLVGEGIDYRDHRVAAGLARDGEGDVIGIDLVDNDNRPFAPLSTPGSSPSHSPAGTELARELVRRGVRIVPVRVPRPETPSRGADLVRGVLFAARTPAPVIVLPFLDAGSSDWVPFARGLPASLAHVLLIAPWAPRGGAYPAALALQEMLVVGNDTSASKPARAAAPRPDVVVEAATPEAAAVIAAAIIVRCIAPKLTGVVTAKSARRAILERWVDTRGVAAAPRLRSCTEASPTGER